MVIQIIMLGITIPIVAILTDAFLKYQKYKLQQSELKAEDKALVERLLKENGELRKRMENLEMIASDPDMIKIDGIGNKEMQKQIEALSAEIKKLKNKN
ncbi:hypothetical protein [Flexithrix dorotheae]|uniref:hypothetical protein n=1 Tax=Flexithrix dorotheae TaxID=70993 RepID=UPI0012FA0AC1|nr:hypothetical protein [Flexithrix dorotheae]